MRVTPRHPKWPLSRTSTSSSCAKLRSLQSNRVTASECVFDGWDAPVRVHVRAANRAPARIARARRLVRQAQGVHIRAEGVHSIKIVRPAFTHRSLLVLHAAHAVRLTFKSVRAQLPCGIACVPRSSLACAFITHRIHALPKGRADWRRGYTIACLPEYESQIAVLPACSHIARYVLQHT